MGAIEDHGQFDLAWKELMRGGLGDDIEDATLAALAEWERENPKSLLARPTWGEVRRANMKGTILEFVTPLDDTTEMRYWKGRAEDGTIIEGFIPVTLPEDGLRVKVGGVAGILYLHPDDEVHLDEATDEEPLDEDDAALQERLMAMSVVEAKIVGVDRASDQQLYGVKLTTEFVLSLLEAWEHIDHDESPCQANANTYLSRFMVQFVQALREGQARREGLES